MDSTSALDSKYKRIIGNAAMLGLIVCGVLLFVINGFIKSSKSRYHAGLARALWKLVTPQSRRENYSEFCWAWRKLILCAAMIACVVMIVVIRMVPSRMVMIIGGSTFAVLVIVLWVLWYFYFLPLLDSELTASIPMPTAVEQQELSKEADGWASKVKIASNSSNDGTSDNDDRRLPVTIITGYLGSGKTTLIKRILTNTIGMKILVIENEIGAEGIDHDLLLQQNGKEEIVLMNNGCICCTVRKDLLAVFHKLFADESFSALNWVVIETTGVADPSPLIQSLYMDDQCRRRMRLDAVIAVVDSKHLPLHVADSRTDPKSGIHGKLPEAVEQLTFADRILLNKSDLVTAEELDDILKTVVQINPTAQLITCQHSIVPLTDILNIRAFDATKNRALLETSVENDVQSLIQVDANGKILRRKINFNINSGANNVNNNNSNSSSGDSSYSGVATISLVAERPLDLDAFNEWLSTLLRVYGNDLYRLKGILDMAGYDRQFVAHGVHMLFDGEVGKPWDQPPSPPRVGKPQQVQALRRVSKLVLIGRNLKEEELRTTFADCVAKNENGETADGQDKKER
jgi:G3E family GTPase